MKHIEREPQEVEKMTEKPRNIEEIKQAFWLNLINFMTLFRLAETALIKPSLLKKLNSYAAWLTFWEGTFIYISSCKFSWSQIVHTMLRQKQKPPNFSIIVPDKQDYSTLEDAVKTMVVKKPHPLNLLGIFIPCANFAQLQIFDHASLDLQLRESAIQLNDA